MTSLQIIHKEKESELTNAIDFAITQLMRERDVPNKTYGTTFVYQDYLINYMSSIFAINS